MPLLAAMTKPCDYCSGTHWMLDQIELGPCVCQAGVFEAAESLMKLDSDPVVIPKFIEWLQSVLDERDGYKADRESLLQATGNSLDALVNRELLAGIEDDADRLGDVQAVMSAYLSSMGLVAPPNRRLQNDHLQELCEVIWP